MDSFLTFLHNNGLLVDIIAMKVCLHGSTVFIATMCYRSSVGIPLKPYPKLIANTIIAIVTAYIAGEVIPFKNLTYATSFIVGLMSDTISNKMTSSSTQSKVVSSVGKAIYERYMLLVKSNKERLDNQKKEMEKDVKLERKEDEENAEEDKNDKEEIEKRLKRKKRTTKH